MYTCICTCTRFWGYDDHTILSISSPLLGNKVSDENEKLNQIARLQKEVHVLVQHIQYVLYMYTCIYKTIMVHEMPRKKSKATQHNRKTKQHNTTRPRHYFSKEVPRVGIKPTTVRLLGDMYMK